MMHANDAKSRPVAEVAAEWFIRLKDGDLGAAERHAYLEWLKRSPEPITEMLKISHTFGAVSAALKGIHPTSISVEQAGNIIDLATRGLVPPPREERWVYRGRIVAVFAIVAVSSLL